MKGERGDGGPNAHAAPTLQTEHSARPARTAGESGAEALAWCSQADADLPSAEAGAAEPAEAIGRPSSAGVHRSMQGQKEKAGPEADRTMTVAADLGSSSCCWHELFPFSFFGRRGSATFCTGKGSSGRSSRRNPLERFTRCLPHRTNVPKMLASALDVEAAEGAVKKRVLFAEAAEALGAFRAGGALRLGSFLRFFKRSVAERVISAVPSPAVIVRAPLPDKPCGGPKEAAREFPASRPFRFRGG